MKAGNKFTSIRNCSAMVLKKKKKSTEVETSDLRNESLQCPTPKTRKKKVS